MDLDAFVAEHTTEWRRLETLSRRSRLTVAQVDELLALYQRVGTHLSTVRTHSPDPALLARLSRIVLAARGAITGGSAFSWRGVARFFTESFPLAVYQSRRWWITCGLVWTAISVGLMYDIANNASLRNKLLTPADAQDLANSSFAGYYSQYPAQHFALQVWTNNALVTGQCLAAGILIVPVLYALFMNALNFGIDGGVMVSYGRTAQFWGLIAPHGLLELTCVFIAGGVGLRIGWSWIAPARGLTRTQSVAETARTAMLIALGLAVALGVSGLLEAFVTPAPLPTAVRVALGAVVWVLFLTYIFAFGSRATRAAASADLDRSLSAEVLPSVG